MQAGSSVEQLRGTLSLESVKRGLTRCRLEKLQHAKAVWRNLMPAIDIPHHEEVIDTEYGSLHLNVIDNEACCIIPARELSQQCLLVLAGFLMQLSKP